MGNVLRISFLGLLITLAASQAQAQAGDSGGDKGEPIRVVISKVNGLGTVDYNVSAKSVSYKGVRMIALTAGNRYSLARNGSFAVTDQVSQLNFVLPSRVYALSVRESVCLDRLQGMKTAGKDSGQMEITFRGRKIAGSGNYLVAEILGCGDLVTGGIESGTPTPAPATPTPGGGGVPTVAPTGKPTVIPTAAVTSTPTTVSPGCTITAQRVGTSNQCTVTVQSTGGAVTGGALSRRNADGVETLKTPVTLTTQSPTNTSTRDCALRGVTFSASVTGVGGTIGNCGPAAVLAVPPTPTPTPTRKK